MNENILLECRKVVMGYDGAAVVNSVSFELERGDYLCICLLYTSPSPRD